MEMQIPNCERVSASGLCPAILAAMSRIIEEYNAKQLYRSPVKDTVTDWKPMKGIPHEFTYMAELGDTTDQSIAAALSTLSKYRRRT